MPFRIVLTLVAAVVSTAVHAQGTGLPVRFVANVTLPGPSNRFDYTSLDRSTNRLYIAHMDAGQLLVFDTRRRRVLKTIAAPGVHGVIAVPALHRVYASATDTHMLYTIDSRNGRVIARSPAGSYPDGLVYETLDNEGIRQEIAFILDTEHGELLCVFLELEKDMDEANNAFFSSPFEIDHRHMAVMDDTTVGGARGRKSAEMMYALKNPASGEREVHLPE